MHIPTGTSPSPETLLGEIVTWDTTASEISISDIRDALGKADLPNVAHDLNNRSAFQRATKHLKENRSIDKIAATKDGMITFQLTKKEVKDDRMDFHYECRVQLNTKTGEITSESLAIEAEARALFAHAMHVRSASDVTRLVQKLFKDNADLFPINPKKGVAYFVPASHTEFTEKVERFLSDVGGDVWRFPVPKGTDHGNRSVRDAVNNGLRAILGELNECVDSWDETTRKGTMTRAIKRWREIKHKAESYAEYLSSEQGNLLAEIEKAKTVLVEKAQKTEQEATAA